jgi:GNAT superfamily N-acetyltransferase
VSGKEKRRKLAPEVKEMFSDEEIVSTFPVMRQLRTHLDEDEYLEMMKRMQRSGYRLSATTEGGEVRCVAGFRVVEFLAYGTFLYVDDLVTAEDARSEGHGERMLDWLTGVAREEGCRSLQLDSGVQRHEAHRFYFRQGMSISSYHFSKPL